MDPRFDVCVCVDFCMFLCMCERLCCDTAGGLSYVSKDTKDFGGYLGTYPIIREGG